MLADSRFPTEQPWIWLVWILIAWSISTLWYIIRPREIVTWTNLSRGVQIVFFTWMVSCIISAIVFVLSWFPDPNHIWDYALIRRIIDGLFESMSGFTTAWGSVLPSVEVFPRSVLMWRSLTHLMWWMGIAYIAVTFFQSLRINREEIVNAESDWPNIVKYDDDYEAIQSGYDFFKIYSLMTILLIVLLFVSGIYFRHTPYIHRYDALFDAVNYAFSTMGTGGFGTYDTSAWLFVTENNQQIIWWLRNIVSERIIAFFMIFAGMNFGIWYELIFYRKWKQFRNTELKRYILTILFVTCAITLTWMQYNHYARYDTLRWVFFSVASVVSTTWLATYDRSTWPEQAIWLLMIVYFTGSCVWSTAGWVKFQRIIIAFRYMWIKISNIVNDKSHHSFVIDDVYYTENQASTVMINIVLYMVMFLLWGTVLLLYINPLLVLPDGTEIENNFETSFGATIANLWNIWPAFEIYGLNDGPSWNYFAFNEWAKIVLFFLMYFGRVGVLSIIFLFIAYKKWHSLHTHADFSSVEFEEGRMGSHRIKK